jgi:hypothetical protein
MASPAIQEKQDKEQHRRATTNHRKAIPKEHEWDHHKKNQSEVTIAIEKKYQTTKYAADTSGKRYDTVLLRQKCA